MQFSNRQTQYQGQYPPPTQYPGQYPPQNQYPMQYPPQNQYRYPPQTTGVPPQTTQGPYPPSQSTQGPYPPQSTQGLYPPSQSTQGPYPPSQPTQGLYPPATPGPYPPPQGTQGPYPPPQGTQGPYPPPQGTQGPYPPSQVTQGYPNTLSKNPPSRLVGNNPLGQPANPSQWYSSFYNQITSAEMQTLMDWFKAVDTDHSGTIEAEELQRVSFQNRPIGLEVAKKLVQVFDRDRNGKIDFHEYAAMHKFISHMRQAFIDADADHSGRIDANEMHRALVNAGFSFLSPGSIAELVNKFDRTRKGLDWCEYLMMVAHIAHCRSVFQWNDKENKGYIVVNEDQFTQISAYLLPS